MRRKRTGALRSLLIIGTVGVVFFWGSGCSKPVNKSDLIGKYVSNYAKNADTLEIKSDGTYVHTFKETSGSVTSNTNSWDFAFEDGKPRITFSKFSFGPDGGSKISGFWDVEVERHGRKLRLIVDPDLNYFYLSGSKGSGINY